MHKPSFPLQFNPFLVYSQVTQEALKGRSGPLCDKSLMAEVGMEIETPQYHYTDSCHVQEDTSPSSSDPYIGAGERTDKLSLFKNKLKSQVQNQCLRHECLAKVGENLTT